MQEIDFAVLLIASSKTKCLRHTIKTQMEIVKIQFANVEPLHIVSANIESAIVE
jgi:hypothetical protein